MLKRKLGKSGIETEALGIGCWAIGGPWHDAVTGQEYGWGEIDDSESIRAIHQAIDLGVTLIDTADNYGAGHSERIVGRAVQGKRSQVVIATKFGYVTDEAAKEALGKNASAAYIKQACEASLRRLGTDYIDLYQFHLGDYPPDQAEEVMAVLEDLVSEGKIRWYGWSTDLPDSAQLFAKGRYCAAIQHDLNIFRENDAILQVCEEYGLASINRGPLAMGLLTGKYSANAGVSNPKDIRGKHNLGWLTYFNSDGKPSPKLTAMLSNIRDILTSGGRTLAQGALAWIWAKSEDTIPIPGFRSMRQVKENVQALQFGPLTKEQMQQIDQILYKESQ
ncbi:aldo/keto reductase [Paenibacillus alkalitolerans]|uniref:aldo/keto reductase n=1 Tax=Paenibacillus alkalitolerans TaxID=2799335 RepID=UPI0018F3BBFE|nr:aldo/keto reductase [Paenibacillus alkalitolerans]